MDKSKAAIHPLFLHLQKSTPAYEARVMSVELSKINMENFNAFYVAKSMPVVVKNAASDWKVVKVENDEIDEFLSREFNSLIEV